MSPARVSVDIKFEGEPYNGSCASVALRTPGNLPIMDVAYLDWQNEKQSIYLLMNVSWHVSDLLDDLDSVKENKAALDLTISEAKMEINTAVQKVNEKIRLLRSKLGIEYNSDTFRVG